jgi:hypothetical protein
MGPSVPSAAILGLVVEPRSQIAAGSPVAASQARLDYQPADVEAGKKPVRFCDQTNRPIRQSIKILRQQAKAA